MALLEGNLIKKEILFVGITLLVLIMELWLYRNMDSLKVGKKLTKDILPVLMKILNLV